MDKIPTVDFLHLSEPKKNPSEQEWKNAAQNIFDALSSIGFVYLTNHGVPSNVVRLDILF